MSPIDRTGCSATRHGTRTAYRANGCTCPDARADHARYNRARQAGLAHLVADHTVDATGSTRRLQALYALGRRERDLAPRLGYARDIPFMHHSERTRIYASTAAKVTALFEELSGTLGPSNKLRERAASWGWHPPLAWYGIDIDDLDAIPDVGPATSGNDSDHVDEIAVVRAINGHPPKPLRRADRLAAITRLAAEGLPSTDIADRVKCGVDRVGTDRNTLDNRRRRTRREAC